MPRASATRDDKLVAVWLDSTDSQKRASTGSARWLQWTKRSASPPSDRRAARPTLRRRAWRARRNRACVEELLTSPSPIGMGEGFAEPPPPVAVRFGQPSRATSIRPSMIKGPARRRTVPAAGSLSRAVDGGRGSRSCAEAYFFSQPRSIQSHACSPVASTPIARSSSITRPRGMGRFLRGGGLPTLPRR